MEQKKYMDIAMFRASGYLQELNRQFLHPLGLAMVVTVDEDGKEELGGIWDSRDDPEGIIYGKFDDDSAEKARLIEVCRVVCARARLKLLGYVIQPIP